MIGKETQIRFKALTEDTEEWIEGNNIILDINRSYINNVPVIYQTICQSLDCTDVNGKLMFTGDIVERKEGNIKRRYLVDRGQLGQICLHKYGYRKAMNNPKLYEIVDNAVDEHLAGRLAVERAPRRQRTADGCVAWFPGDGWLHGCFLAGGVPAFVARDVAPGAGKAGTRSQREGRAPTRIIRGTGQEI